MRIDRITAWEAELMKPNQSTSPKKGSQNIRNRDTFELSEQAKALALRKGNSTPKSKQKLIPPESNPSEQISRKEKLQQIQKKIDSGTYHNKKVYSVIAEKLLQLFGI